MKTFNTFNANPGHQKITPRTARMANRKVAIASGIAMLFATGTGHAILLGDSANGKVVHDAKCMGCHAAQFKEPSKVYTRSNHTVKTVEGLMKRVEFCSKQTGAKLSDEEINDVVKYLNDSFYKFE